MQIGDVVERLDGNFLATKVGQHYIIDDIDGRGPVKHLKLVLNNQARTPIVGRYSIKHFKVIDSQKTPRTLTKADLVKLMEITYTAGVNNLKVDYTKIINNYLTN